MTHDFRTTQQIASESQEDWAPLTDDEAEAQVAASISLQAEEWWEDEAEAASALYHKKRKLSDYLLTVRDLDKIPEATWLVEGVLPQDAIAALYAAPGAGKTFVALDWAAHLAAGKGEWEGRALLPDARVLYIYAEGAPGLKKRRDAWETHHEAEVPGDRLLFIIRAADFLATTGYEEPAEDDWSEMLTITERIKPHLIVVDTMSRAIPGSDENDQATMSKLMSRVDELRECSGWATVLFLHHTNASGTRERGSTVLRGAVNTLVNIDEDGILRVVKQRDDQEPTIGKVSLLPVEDTGSVVPTYESVEDGGIDKDAIRRAVLIETIRATPGLTISALHEKVEGGKGKLLTMLSTLETEGVIECQKEGRSKTVRLRSVQSRLLQETGRD